MALEKEALVGVPHAIRRRPCKTQFNSGLGSNPCCTSAFAFHAFSWLVRQFAKGEGKGPLVRL